MRDVREMSSAELQSELAASEGVDCACSSGPASSQCDEAAESASSSKFSPSEVISCE